jgi:hypothetical protein
MMLDDKNMNIEQWLNETDRESEVLQETVSQYHFGHCRSHVDCLSAEPGLPQHEAGN